MMIHFDRDVDVDEKKGVLDNGHEIMSCEFAKIRQAVFRMVNI
jgi:hypothetical protein